MFRANRMRDEITISLIGPLPRSHSPAWLVRSFSFISGCCLLLVACCSSRSASNKQQATILPFSLPNLIAQLRGPLVIFCFYRAAQFFSQLGKIDGLLDRHS